MLLVADPHSTQPQARNKDTQCLDVSVNFITLQWAMLVRAELGSACLLPAHESLLPCTDYVAPTMATLAVVWGRTPWPDLGRQAERGERLRSVAQVSPLEDSLVWGTLHDAEALLHPHHEAMRAEWEAQHGWGAVPDLEELAGAGAGGGLQAAAARTHSIR